MPVDRRPVLAVAAAVALLATAALVAAQNCLPGQQPCGSTCCNTNQNYTCCPYNGGYCAAPDQQCCEGAQGGLCPKTSACCDDGCADSTHECCNAYVCALGQCCQGDPQFYSDYFCRDASQHCCKGGGNTSDVIIQPSAFACEKGTTCCSVLTSRQCSGQNNFAQDARNDCCAAGTVCCPSAPEVNNEFVRKMLQMSRRPREAAAQYESEACGGNYASRNPFAKEGPASAPPKPAAALDNPNVTSCADPNKEFCCGGMACPTETLCCPGDETTFGDGCCFGIPSRSNSCTGYRNSTCPTSAV